MSTAIAPGSLAPDFDLPAHTGARVRLSALRGRVVVLFFYPKDETAICTAEACAFRDRSAAFAEDGAVVLGVSSDDVASHLAFAAKHGLGYPLLSDAGGAVRKAYGATTAFGLVPGRTTFVIDAAGTVQFRHDAMLESSRHAEEALAVVNRLVAGA